MSWDVSLAHFALVGIVFLFIDCTGHHVLTLLVVNGAFGAAARSCTDFVRRAECVAIRGIDHVSGFFISEVIEVRSPVSGVPEVIRDRIAQPVLNVSVGKFLGRFLEF